MQNENWYTILTLLLNVLTAIGTVGTVIISLCFARKQSEAKKLLQMKVIGFGKTAIKSDYGDYNTVILYLEISNLSNIDIEICGCSLIWWNALGCKIYSCSPPKILHSENGIVKAHAHSVSASFIFHTIDDNAIKEITAFRFFKKRPLLHFATQLGMFYKASIPNCALKELKNHIGKRHEALSDTQWKQNTKEIN